MSDENFNERTKKAFDFYADSTKQLITLSTAIIAVTITFAKDVLGALPGFAKLPLMIALIGYLVSVWYGLGTLLSLTGELQPIKFIKALQRQNSSPPESPPSFAIEDWPIPSIYAKKINHPSRMQVILFALATMLVVVTAIIVALPINRNSDDEKGLKELEVQWSQAYRERNTQLLERILSNDFVSANAYGRVFNKKEFVDEIKSNASTESIDSADIKARIYGDTAIVTGIQLFKVKAENESRTDLVRFTHVYAKQQGRWQVVAAQETFIR